MPNALQVDLSKLYEPHPFQVRVHESTAKNKVIEAARRLGKSRVALWELIKTWVEVVQTPAESSLQPPFHAWIVAPSYPQSEQVWNELMAFIPEQWMRRPPNQEYKRIELNGQPGGRSWGLIEVKSAHDPDSLQTAGLDFLWVTEAQELHNRAFEKMRPMVNSPNRMGRAVWEGIPALWRDHWFWRLCDYAAAGHDNYDYFHGTVYDNPLLSEQQYNEVQEERHLLTDASWRRMYLAERSETAGFFKNIENCTAGDMFAGPMPGARYVAGIDLGRKHDASVLWIMDATERRGVYHQTWDSGEDWTQQREGMVYACNLFDIDRVSVDATGMGGDIFSQALSEAGLPVEDYIFTESTRMHMLNSLAVAMERNNVSFPNEQNLIRQLRAFQFLKKGNGKPRPDHPDGEHDDEIFALGMALLLCDEGVPETFRVRGSGPMSYMPAPGRAMGVGARMMREAKLQRIEERWERSGVTY
jgi:hypothetical protein